MVHLNSTLDMMKAAVAQNLCRRYQVHGMWYTPGLIENHGYRTTGVEKWQSRGFGGKKLVRRSIRVR